MGSRFLATIPLGFITTDACCECSGIGGSFNLFENTTGAFFALLRSVRVRDVGLVATGNLTNHHKLRSVSCLYHQTHILGVVLRHL